MRPLRHASAQRGDVLLEALIGTLLMSIVGLGMVYTSSRQLVTQRHLNAQTIAVQQLRAVLERYGTGLCDDASPALVSMPGGEQLVAKVTCHTADAATIGGNTPKSAPVNVQLSVTDVDAFGKPGTVVVGDGTS